MQPKSGERCIYHGIAPIAIFSVDTRIAIITLRLCKCPSQRFRTIFANLVEIKMQVGDGGISTECTRHCHRTSIADGIPSHIHTDHTPIDSEGCGQNHRTVWADVVAVESELLQSLVGMKRCRECCSALGTKAVVVQTDCLQRTVCR